MVRSCPAPMASRELFFARRAAWKKIRYIGAGDQQHQAGQSHDHSQRFAECLAQNGGAFRARSNDQMTNPALPPAKPMPT